MAEALVAAVSSNYHPKNPTSKPPLGLSKDKYVNPVKKQKNVAVYHKDDTGGLFGDKLTLEKSNVEKSLSWGNLTQLSLTEHHRSLSASNIYALHDPDLSIKAAISKKAYDKPHTSFSKEKAKFTAWTQKYYHQLTVGCGNRRCKNVFCKSSSRMKKFDQRMIPLISIELSGYKNQYLCIKDKKKQDAKVLDVDLFNMDTTESNNEQVPFLYRFYSMSPFRSLFLPCPLTPSGLGLHKTHSQGELNTPKKVKPDTDKQETNLTDTFKSHLTSLTTSISSSVSNIFHYTSNSDMKEEESNIKNKSNDNENWALDEKESSEVPTSPSCGDQFLTRRRIPSVRIFGDEYAVDTDTSLHENIDEFEKSVAEEFKKECSGNEFEDSVLSEEDVTIFPEDQDDENLEEPDGYSLTHLTLDMFQKILTNYQECQDESFLLNTIRTVFASWDALMLSFLDEGISKVKKHPFNVKIGDVHEVFYLLEQFDKHDKFRTVLTDTVQVMLLKKQSIKEARELKPVIVILLMPYLFNYIDVVLEVSSMISRLSVDHLSILSSFIADCFKEDKFVYLVQGIKSLIETESTRSGSILRNNERVVSLCKTMHLLYTANTVNGDYKTVVSNTLFYCEELTSKVDFKQVYAYWKRRNFSTTNSILNYPFLLEPAVKVNVIHIDAITQMREEYQDAIVHQARMNQVQKSWSDFNDASKRSHEVRSAMCPYLLLEIRRANLISDTLKQLQEKNSDLKKPLKIKYTAGGEQGLDMGGLQKEFFQVIVETVFDTNYGLFNESEDGNVVWFNAYSFEATVMFELVGILLGLAIYNGIILDVHFPLLVYKKLLGYKVVLHDLHDIQPTLAKSLEQLLNYSGDVADDFCQTFQVSHSVYGKPTNVELVANGHNVLVTNENRGHFVELYVDNILNKSIDEQFKAFKKGFYQVCNGPTTKLFTPPELELLVCGNPNLDFLALEEATEYRDGYSKAHALMVSFWKIVHKFTFKQKQALLMFVTGSYRVPLKGLGAMSFYIQRNGPDSNNLPTSMTCFNRLLLPEYCSAQKLEGMLLLAVENSKGFGLT